MRLAWRREPQLGPYVPVPVNMTRTPRHHQEVECAIWAFADKEKQAPSLQSKPGKVRPEGAALACLFLEPRVLPLQPLSYLGGAAMWHMPGMQSIPVTQPHGSWQGGTALPHDRLRQTGLGNHQRWHGSKRGITDTQ